MIQLKLSNIRYSLEFIWTEGVNTPLSPGWKSIASNFTRYRMEEGKRGLCWHGNCFKDTPELCSAEVQPLFLSTSRLFSSSYETAAQYLVHRDLCTVLLMESSAEICLKKSQVFFCTGSEPGYVLSSILPRYTIYDSLSFQKFRRHGHLLLCCGLSTSLSSQDTRDLHGLDGDPHTHRCPQGWELGYHSRLRRKAMGSLPRSPFQLVCLALQTLLQLPSSQTRSRAPGIPPSTASAHRQGFPRLCSITRTHCWGSSRAVLLLHSEHCWGGQPWRTGSEQLLLQTGAPANAWHKQGS